MDGIEPLVRAHFPWVVYIPCSENIGFGRANNLGYSRSSGEIVLYLNPDTICNAQALDACFGMLKEYPEIGVVSPRLVLADGATDLACRRSIPSLWDGFCRASGLSKLFPKWKLFAGYNLTYLPERGTYPVGAVNGAFMMIKRHVIEEVGLFDENFFMYGDDLDLCIRVGMAGYKVVYFGGVEIIHLKGVSVAKDFKAMSVAIFDANRDVFLKHFNPNNSWYTRFKYKIAFDLWKRIALLRASVCGYRRVKPL